jgi:acetaldehyde dehydrogenase
MITQGDERECRPDTTFGTATHDAARVARPLRVAILGSGNIGTDLLMKVQRSELLACGAFVGRRDKSPGLAAAKAWGVPTSSSGINYFLDNPDCFDLLFDATSARGHADHLPALRSLGKRSIDLTPAGLGPMCVPAVNGDTCTREANINMITCGGQAAIPVAFAIAKSQPQIQSLEIISSVASISAGPATRANIDEYLITTEYGVRELTGIRKCKVMLNLNPASPCIDMQTTILADIPDLDLASLDEALGSMIARVQEYVPGYRLLFKPRREGGRLVVSLRTRGCGDFLPEYAGNLDIINCAAIVAAERFAIHGIDAAKSTTVPA